MVKHIRITIGDDVASDLEEIKDECGYTWSEMLLHGHDLDFFGEYGVDDDA